jgi:hypothetical protein
VLGAADLVRGKVLRGLAGTALRPFLLARERRIGLRAALTIGAACGLATVAPALTLALGPLLFGVPHAAASLRYLVLRRGLSVWLIGALVAVSLLVVGARIYGAVLRPGTSLPVHLELFAGASLFAVACVEGARRSGNHLRALGLLSVLALGVPFALSAPHAVRLAFVHVHNLGVVALWLLLFRRRGAAPKVVAGGVLVAILVLASGLTAPIARATGGLHMLGVDVAEVGRWLAPSVGPQWAIPLVLVHAFTDSVHYAFWLGVVPEEELKGEGTLTFRMTARSLRRDFRVGGLAVVAFATLAIAGLGVANGALARSAYFVVAGFHGYIEGAMLLYFLVVGRGSGLRRGSKDAGMDPPGSIRGRTAA